MTSSQVNYLARCGNFVEKGLAYKGTLRTLKVILGYDYLWINVRVKGGAYGVMNGAGRFGDIIYSIIFLYDKDIKERKVSCGQFPALSFGMPAHGIHLYDYVHGAALSAPAWKNII